MAEESVKNEILRLWNLIVRNFTENFDVKQDRLVVKLDRKSIPHLFFQKKRHRVKSEDFEILFKTTGEILAYSSNCRLFFCSM